MKYYYKVWLSIIYIILLEKSSQHGHRNSQSGPVEAEYQIITSGELHVGDIVRIHDGESFPADLVLLTSSEENGIAYIDTANLDGETNHKKRIAPKDINNKYQHETLFSDLDGFIICDVPDDLLNQYHGILGRDGFDDISLDLVNVYIIIIFYLLICLFLYFYLYFCFY